MAPKSVAPNQAVTATGVNYSGSNGQPVVVKWGSRNGPTLATTFPTPDGRINTPITIPEAAKAGSNLVLALQNNANGTPKSGTPGRTTVQVSASSRAGSKSDTAPGGAWGPSKSGSGGAGAVVTLDGAESASPALLSTLLGGLLSVGLLGTGLVLVRRSRTAKPALGI